MGIEDLIKGLEEIKLGYLNYEAYLEKTQNTDYELSDLQKLVDSDKFVGYAKNDNKVNYIFGIYLSAFVNNKMQEDGKLELSLKKLNDNHILLHKIGRSFSRGRLIVKGNAGSWLGEDMKEGSIIVNGNAGHLLGEYMKGGSIIVKGNAGDGLGFAMKGGSVVVKGNAGDGLGWYMEGGIIMANKIKRISDYYKSGVILERCTGRIKSNELIDKAFPDELKENNYYLLKHVLSFPDVQRKPEKYFTKEYVETKEFQFLLRALKMIRRF